METAILGEGPETVAEVIVEPVMSGVGVAVPPDEYLPEVEGLCRKYGILLHVDEVINGFGRTGKMFAHQHYGVSPDIIAVAKGISIAYQPIAATVGEKQRLRQLLRRAPSGSRALRRLHCALCDSGRYVARAERLRFAKIELRFTEAIESRIQN
jgi:adenosylmethionine-8-amino-7-oxononanoate aminotransferase